ncbi:NAD(P)-dependent alcohol dehydrogenase [Agromyces intestinalis]|uniref:NAD(P)-dependent alcohol dehydrogenase n=1 Tax=Agromyces intestinalis TaxID=2592652 RepID=A0A5C1YGP5_9MICO|nr:NAD(P)-dependent alcohol dehydrogenase [Agromyces intestinalis]QEO15386.1 NAD(P)-dependent alcohol dehydrogenase [Agromyces intestinalis]
MLAAVFERYGPPEVVHLAERPLPEPGPGEVRVRVHTSVVGSADAAGRSGSPWFARLFFGLRRPRREVLGTDFAGAVDAVGPGASLVIGDRVFGFTGPNGGGNAEFAIVSAGGVVLPTPSSLDDVEAVAAIEGFLTALPFLRDTCGVRPGDEVLVNGASGAVGSTAVQLARWMGARVTAVTSTPNVDRVRALGADRVIDYTAERFIDARDAYDAVFDAVGASSFGRCRRSLTRRGVYATTVPSFGVLALMPLSRLFGRRRAAISFTGLLPVARKRDDLRLLCELVEQGAFVPVIDRVVPFERIAEAHARVDTHRKVGAVVVAMAGAAR